MRHNLNYIVSMLKKQDVKIKFAYISGSLIEGFGNDTSDLDVFAICEESDECLYEKKNCEKNIMINEGRFIEIYINEGLRYDVEFISMSQVEKLCQRLNCLDFRTENHLPRFEEEEIDFLHRIKCGKGIINDSDFMRYREKIDFGKLQIYISKKKIVKYYGYLEDIEGAVNSGDYGSAYIMLRLYIYTIFEAYLSIFGETNPNTKWIYRKIMRYQKNFGETDLLPKFLFCIGYYYQKETFENYYNIVLDIAQKLNQEIQDRITMIIK